MKRGAMYAVVCAVLFVLPAEATHRWVIGVLRLLSLPPVPRLLGWLLNRRDPVLAVRAMGLEFSGPVVMAAGFDKNAVAYRALGGLGFAAVEVGTVTARPQPGNPRPRMFRLPRDKAIINRMGFNNCGAAAVAQRLGHSKGMIVGVNIGKSKAAAETEAVADYVDSARQLGPLAGYVVVNVSSPNTPGLRDLQAVGKLRPLLAAVRQELDGASPGRRVPLLVKIAPDLADADIDAVADLAVGLGLDGIVAVNTTITRDGLVTSPARVAEIGAGGLSGPPVKARAVEVLRRLRARAGNQLVLISVGGIATADDAWERLQAGATLVQAYTGIVYGGPLWALRINRQLAARARKEGLDHVPAAAGR